MKRQYLADPASLLAVFGIALHFMPGSLPRALAQGGSLTPPGAPAPTMKTLDQIEPRSPISSLPFTIGSPGSYYLAASLSVAAGDAITITADNVTLDLNGFTLSSTASPASGTAVLISGTRSNVRVRNGHIRGATTVVGSTFTTGGFLDGISHSSNTSTSTHVTDVQVTGVGRNAIYLDYNAANTSTTGFVGHCLVDIAGTTGILARHVSDCSAKNIGGIAIRPQSVVNSHGVSVGTSAGNSAITGAFTAENCKGDAVGGIGISATNVINSQGISSTNTGINAALAVNCLGISSSGAGINATGSLGGNVSNSTGVSTSGTGLVADIAANSTGRSTSGAFGMDITGTASFCRGQRDGGVAIQAGIAIGCTVSGSGTVASANKLLGTP